MVCANVCVTDYSKSDADPALSPRSNQSNADSMLSPRSNPDGREARALCRPGSASFSPREGERVNVYLHCFVVDSDYIVGDWADVMKT